MLSVQVLGDVFEAHRKLCLDQLKLEAAAHITGPQLFLNAAKLKTGCKIQLITKLKEFEFCERALIGGVVSVGSSSHVKANVPEFIPLVETSSCSIP